MSKERESEEEKREYGTFDGGTSILDPWSRPSCQAVHARVILRQQTNQSRPEGVKSTTMKLGREGVAMGAGRSSKGVT